MTTRSVLFAVWTLLLPASALSAQGFPSVTVLPRIGLLSPDGYLYEQFANFADDEPTEWTTGSLGRSAVLGVAVSLTYPEAGFALRGELARSFRGWLSAVHGIVKPRVLFDPPQIVNTWLDVPAALTFLNLQAVLPTRLEVGPVRPYVSVGGGGKWYTFGSPTRPNTVEAILPSGGFTWALDLGGGATVSLFGLDFDLHIRDSINRYWGKTQHDLLFSGGLAWRLK